MNNLKSFRLKNNKSQEELALEFGVTTRYIAFLESGGRTPSLELARKIASYFETTIEEIFLASECTNSTLEQE